MSSNIVKSAALTILLCTYLSGYAHAQYSALSNSADQEVRSVKAGKIDSIPLKLNSSTVGGSVIYGIFDDASLVISLILPNGAVVNAANASSRNYEWLHLSASDPDSSGLFSSDAEGERLIIELPEGAARGTYRVRVDARAAVEDATVTVGVVLVSGVMATVSVDRPKYSLGETVIVTGVVKEEEQTLKSPSMKLEVNRTNPISGGLSIPKLRFVRTGTLGGGRYRHYFAADLESQTVTAQVVTATPSSGDDDVRFGEAVLTFQGVQAGATTKTSTMISVYTGSRTVPKVANWGWSFEEKQTLMSGPMQDSGPADAVAGDGIFTAKLVPAQAGEYSATLTVTGKNIAGAAFKRVDSTNFRVIGGNGSVR